MQTQYDCYSMRKVISYGCRLQRIQGPITFQNGCFFPSSFFNNEILILEIRLLNYKKPLSASVSVAKSMTYWILDIFKYSNLFDILDLRSLDLAIMHGGCNSVKCVLIPKSLCIDAQCNGNKDFTIYRWTLRKYIEGSIILSPP